MTNGDRIRKMSNEELAEYIYDNFGCKSCVYRYESPKCPTASCIEGIKAYLESEVE